jgi:peptidoglycan/LPS O-acetylase OafA/YrhL
MSKNTILSFPKENNFDFLRLIFALQVALIHLNDHMGFDIPEFLSSFPGVPAFFFVSGFLIYSSYQYSPGKNYFLNRFLRLFPGLIFVTIGGLLVVVIAKGIHAILEKYDLMFIWFLSQITIGQAYNPSFFRDVGVGVINGALWTITV